MTLTEFLASGAAIAAVTQGPQYILAWRKRRAEKAEPTPGNGEVLAAVHSVGARVDKLDSRVDDLARAVRAAQQTNAIHEDRWAAIRPIRRSAP